ncbi:MAG: TIGR01548 family HAD-type hydrolase [Geminocystis sp.]|nr:TIGR01548 family HAD-type hydrolase [Geminocystis sp.]HIK38839.1 TIGR01548 family HAD-type hydrolase [Geminocystis sp. M7585_C2015_104]MCS7147164.1 TIGR01548 family HAD-type hydrolase [Geminocystis sp.]MCX8078611.1 TIGR01548 family HAD-type hydrolase [Geminocystis sp.]MDW8116160.1 TIGR01548 family HAD-type hydrolase [Geminocystis sp.]
MTAFVVFDIDGVIRDVANSYSRAIADTVEHFTNQKYRPSLEDIDLLKSEGLWNNDWLASQELIYRYFEKQGLTRESVSISYEEIVDYFQRRYRGENLDNPDMWDGYISQEPILADKSYFDSLTQNGLYWGFFSGATRGSANYILQRRLGLENPVLVAMEDAPGKPEPTGLFLAVQLIAEKFSLPPNNSLPVFYLGDTVADMMTVQQARKIHPQRQWIAIGVLPPHLHSDPYRKEKYRQILLNSGANDVIDKVTDFNPKLGDAPYF